jgi:tetratricopeptide (TPR) repeat protein
MRRLRVGFVVLALVALAALGLRANASFGRYLASGQHYFSSGRYHEAVIEFRNASRKSPQSAAAQVKLGDSYAALHQANAATAAYEQACRLDAHDASTCLKAAAGLLAMGDYEGATTAARAVLGTDRFSLDANLILASSLAGVRRFADAQERLAAALASAPADARVYRTAGDVQWRRGDAAAAERALLKAIALDPASTPSRVSLARLYFDTDRPDDGASQLRAALDESPHDVDANRMYASYLEANQCGDASPYLQDVAAQTPDGSGGLALADYYVSSGRVDDALEVLQPLAMGADAGGAARGRVAAILYDRGQRPQAAQIVDGLLKEDASNLNALLLKARMSLDVSDIADAREYAHRAAEMSPGAAAVREVLAAIGTDK